MTFTEYDALEIAIKAYEVEDKRYLAEVLNWGDNDKPVETDEYTISLRESEFGYEGGPRMVYFVLSFVNKETTHEFFLKVSAEYDSWEGPYWEYCTPNFVQPKVVTVTEWEYV